MTLPQIQKALAILVGVFVFYTAAAGPFEGLVQRALFLALVTALGFALYPLGAGKSWRPFGLAIDLLLTAIAVSACGYIIWNYERIMSSLPWATTLEMALTAGLVLAVLELGRRTVGIIFPILVSTGVLYALYGNLLPGTLSHRGFDAAFVTETIFLGDLGIWGMLTGVAATVIAAFVLFGSLLLHTGGGQAFMDIAMRLGGQQPGGAAKIATIASGLFGTISGSAVANVATTGNFTINMMIRLGYPRPFAAAVEAVASTGGQLAPPIMGAAAFVMAEILGIPYVTIILGAIIPALLFYISVFLTVHFVAIRRNLAVVPEGDLPEWRTIVAPRRILPIVLAFGGLGLAIYMGRSIATAAFYGVLGLLIAFVLTQAGNVSVREMITKVTDGLEDAGKGMVIIGVLLAGAQVLVSMINLTGIGVTMSTLIVATAGDVVPLVAIIVAGVCLVMGMGLPTTAAYVLVAATLAPAMTAVGVDPLVAHLFVFYYATISVITPPVCVAVFVGSGIAQTNWLPAAGQAVRLGAVTYLIPFLFLLYPGMTMQGTWIEALQGLVAGIVLVIAIPALLSGIRVTGSRVFDIAIMLAAIGIAVFPHPVSPFVALALLAGVYAMRATNRKSLA
ncbi:TRAP transporter fused permease subunit [Gymnodinialimonas sp. 57CJ19]|uniref:TRAP transporter permease n=1 Tax=Gymnodinialimonas sp. 57CJ19 TaxID=3138498 RepID=UPI0031346069